VHLVILVLERSDRHRDRDPAACLLGVEVGGGVAVLYAAHPRDRARDEEERLGEAGLPGPSVTDEHDVPDLRRRIDLQSRFPLATLSHVLERSLGPGSPDPAGREGEKNGGGTVKWSRTRARKDHTCSTDAGAPMSSAGSSRLARACSAPGSTPTS